MANAAQQLADAIGADADALTAWLSANRMKLVPSSYQGVCTPEICHECSEVGCVTRMITCVSCEAKMCYQCAQSEWYDVVISPTCRHCMPHEPNVIVRVVREPCALLQREQNPVSDASRQR